MQLKSILTTSWCLGLVGASRSANRPNIVFILTDDQDTHMNSLEYMPYVQKHLIGQGTNFERHYCTGESVDRTSESYSITYLCPKLRYVVQAGSTYGLGKWPITQM